MSRKYILNDIIVYVIESHKIDSKTSDIGKNTNVYARTILNIVKKFKDMGNIKPLMHAYGRGKPYEITPCTLKVLKRNKKNHTLMARKRK